MAHFNFENERDNALRALDAPIANGPPMRWQKKLGESSSTSLLNGSMNTTASAPNASAAKTPMKSAANVSNIQNGCKSTPSSKTPGGARPTPTGKSKTPSNGGSSKTPSSSAKNKASDDRFIPNRNGTQFELGHYRLTGQDETAGDLKESDDASAGVTTCGRRDYQRVMNENLNGEQNDARIISYQPKPPVARDGHTNSLRVLYSAHKTPGSSKKHTARHIPQMPERVLDAPDLMDDYYLNLLSWSSTNVVAVALGCRLYLWNANDGTITQLTELEDDMYISSVSWAKEDQYLALGLSTGEVQIYDAAHKKRLRNMPGHAGRVGALAWNSFILSSGARSGAIHQHDVRQAAHHVGTLANHTQEVCGLQWSPDSRHLASGGNDNIVNVWSAVATAGNAGNEPVHSFNLHQAAVKAVAWCPWQNSLLATGGGTADRCIKFWNISTGACLNSVDTKSQVCSILWSKEYKELISGHGFTENQLIIWKYPTMEKVTELTGHTGRVLQLAMSPDGSTVMSAAADESLRIWKCFAADPAKSKAAGNSTSKATGPIARPSIR